LRVQRHVLEQARLGIEREIGIYDVNLAATLSTSHDESPSSSELEGAAVQISDRDVASVSASQLFPTGGAVSLGTSATKLETNSIFFDLNPSYSSGLDFSLSQPLLRNFGKGATEFALTIARLDSGQSREAFTEQVILTLQLVENAYWLLVEAKEQLKVAEESRRLATQLHENNKVRVDVGTLAPLELVSSEAGIATREEEVIRARAAVGNAEDVLKTLLRLEGDAAWAAPVVLETTPEIDAPEVVLDAALETAMASRPELERQRLAQQVLDVTAAYYSAQRKPRLDLRATYGFNGLGGDRLLTDSEGNVIGVAAGDVSDAYEQIFDQDFPGWSVGLEFGFPLQNRTARARAAIAEVAADQGQVEMAQLEQRINTEVRLAVRALDTAKQELESARVSVRPQNANLDAERKKFLNGLSTSFQILEVEEDLTNARSREARAVTAYRRALVEYHRAIGKLLERTQVTIEG
jgi:outer membrane protein TolC